MRFCRNPPGFGENGVADAAGGCRHRNVLREGAKALYRALGAGGDDNRSKKRGAPESAADPSQMTPEEEVLLLHVME